MTRMTVGQVKAAQKRGAVVEGLEPGESLGSANDSAPEWLTAWQSGLLALDQSYEASPASRRFYFSFRRFGRATEWLRDEQFSNFVGWRFDYCELTNRVAVEVDGIARNVKGGGRHTTASDNVKTTTARGLGWAVFQFVPELLKTSPQLCAAAVAAELMRRENWGTQVDLHVRMFLADFINVESGDAWRATGGR